MSTTITPQQPSRKQSFLRHKIRESFRPSALREYLHHSEKDGGGSDKQRTSVDGKRASMEESSWIVRKRRKNKASKDEEPKHVLGELKIDVGGFDDLKMSLDLGSEMYSLKSPETVATPATAATIETNITLKSAQKPLMQKLNQYSPIKDQKMAFPSPIELEDTSNNMNRPEDPMDVDIEPPQPQLEVRKGPKWQIKTGTLVRPVSSGRANALSANVSQTIAAINKNNFHVNGKWSSHVDNMASARPSMESSRSKMTSQTNATDKVDSVLGSNASITPTYGNTRRPLGDTARNNNLDTDRHTVADVDKSMNGQSSAAAEQENKRQSFPPVAVRRQSLINIHSAQQPRPKSPTGSIASTASAMPQSRRQSGTNVSSRLSWIQDLENAGKKNPGQEYMMNKLQGGVAEKLRRFESQNSQASGSSSRSQSATRSTSATRGGSDAYGIESGPAVAGKRLSRTVTADDDFRKKLEEQFQRKQKEDEERERKKKNRASLPATMGRTPQQIIDYVELSDKDREAEINDLMRNGKGPENAKKLDVQAKAALHTQQATARPRQPNAVFQNATAALKSTTNLLDFSGSKTSTTGSVALKNGTSCTTQSTTALARTMSVQQQSRKVSPAAAMSPRPVSSAPPVSASMDDGEYDPFNYAVYPSRSSIYSNPPEVPVVTPEVELDEEEGLPVIEDSTAMLVAEDAEEEAENAVEKVVVAEETAEPASTIEIHEAKPEEATALVEPPKTKAAPASMPSTRAETPKEALKLAPPTSGGGWAARFQCTPAKTPTPSALPLRIHSSANKPPAVLESATAAITSAPRQDEDKGIARTLSSEELVAQEAVPASPTLVDIPSSKKMTPVKERFVQPIENEKAVEAEQPEGKQPTVPAVPVEEPSKSAIAEAESKAVPKSSLPVRSAPRPTTPQKKQTPSSLLLSNGSVKIASPCSSPKSPKKRESNSAAVGHCLNSQSKE